MTDLDEAVRKLLTTPNHAGAMIDLIRIWGMEEVPRNKGHMYAMSRESADALLPAMWRVHLMHEDLLKSGQGGVGNWTQYLQKILGKPKRAPDPSILQGVGEAKPAPAPLSQPQQDAFDACAMMHYDTGKVRELLLSSKETTAQALLAYVQDELPPPYLSDALLRPKLGAERGAK